MGPRNAGPGDDTTKAERVRKNKVVSFGLAAAVRLPKKA
jgi:hypothetical protein